jgi:hypothetical protein
LVVVQPFILNVKVQIASGAKLKCVSIKIIAGFLLSGLTFENYLEVFYTVDLQPSSNNIWENLLKLLLIHGRKLLKAKLELNQ